MVVVALDGGSEVLRIVAPKHWVIQAIRIGITPHGAFFDDHHSGFIGQVIPLFVPRPGMQSHGHVVAGFDIHEDFLNLRSGGQEGWRPSGCRVQVDWGAIEVKLAANGPELAEAKPRVEGVGCAEAGDGSVEKIEMRIEVAPKMWIRPRR